MYFFIIYKKSMNNVIAITNRKLEFLNIIGKKNHYTNEYTEK